MKDILLIAASAAVVCFCSCRSVELEPEQICGKWNCCAVDCGRSSAERIIPMTVCFHPDGSFTTEYDEGNSGPERESGTWKRDGDSVSMTSLTGTCRWRIRSAERLEMSAENREFFPRGILFILKKENGGR